MMRACRALSGFLCILPVLLFISGCGAPKPVVDPADRVLAAQVGLPEAFLAQLKAEGGNMRRLQGMDRLGKPIAAAGVTVDVPGDRSDQAVRRLAATAPPGWLAFVSERNFGIGGKPDRVALLKTKDPFAVITLMSTNGCNFDISTEMVLARVREWDKRFGLTLTGAGLDWLEASFNRQPEDMKRFAAEVYKFCPDVVDQGSGSVDALAEEMRKSNSVYLWWD